MSENIKTNVISGFLWKAMESGGDQLITFLISVILARLLGPEKYGTMAIMLIFLSVANVLVQSGFQTALIQKKDAQDIDFDSAFFASLAAAVFLYIILFAGAPLIASFFNDESIAPMLRVLSLILLFGAVTSVENAVIAREMTFRKQCIATILSAVLSGIAGVIAAFNGAGTWALVIQQLVRNFFLMVILFFVSSWKPAFRCDLKRVRELLSYGWKVLASGLIDVIYSNIYTPVISRLYNAATVGNYNRANQFPQVVANSMAQTIQSVMLSAFSKKQDNRAESKIMMRRTLKTGSYIMFPVLFGIMAVAEPMVRVILGEQWMDSVEMLRICCIAYSVWHIHVINLQAVNANGRSDIYLKLEIIKKIVGTVLLIVSVPLGLTWMILMKAVFDYVCTVINAWPNGKLLSYGPLEQWKDMLPEFLLSAGMGIAVYGLYVFISGTGLVNTATSLGALIAMTLQIIAGVVIYLLGSAVFRMESFRYLLENVKAVTFRKK